MNGTPMPSFSDLLEAEVVTEEQLWEVAHFVKSLSPEAPRVSEVVRAALLGEGELPASVDDERWAGVERFYIPLVGQVIEEPRWFAPSVDGVWVQALHDGDLRIGNLVASEGLVDTGSGNANLEFTGGTLDGLSIDTGSGDVNITLPPSVDARVSIESGSGNADVQRADAVFERRDDGETVFRLGQGQGRVRIDTGSGDVVIR